MNLKDKTEKQVLRLIKNKIILDQKQWAIITYNDSLVPTQSREKQSEKAYNKSKEISSLLRAASKEFKEGRWDNLIIACNASLDEYSKKSLEG